MPAYVAGNAIGLTVGDRVVLVNNAATDSGITSTQQVALSQQEAAGSATLALHNGTNQTATVQVADVDATGNYRALTDANTAEAITVATSLSIVFTCIGPFLRCNFGTAPTTGTLAITR